MGDVENSRFCPFCGRWLATLKENGRLDLASRASVFGVALPDITQAIPADHGGYQVPLFLEEGYESECLRPLCRFRRWLGQ